MIIIFLQKNLIRKCYKLPTLYMLNSYILTYGIHVQFLLMVSMEYTISALSNFSEFTSFLVYF